MKRVHVIVLGAVVLGAFAQRNAFGEFAFTILDLGTLGGNSSSASAINNKGQVAGGSFLPGTGIFAGKSVEHAFLTQPNSAINPVTDDLGPYDQMYGAATGLNLSGQVVGTFYTPGVNSGQLTGFRTKPGGAVDSSADLFAGAQPKKMNDSGQTVGFTSALGGPTHAFRTDGGQPYNAVTDDLGTLGGARSFGNAINNLGQVVGESLVALTSSSNHAFRTAPNAAINPLTDDLGTLGGAISNALGINESGQVTGNSTINATTSHAFRTAPNAKIDPATDDLGVLPGYASSIGQAINEAGLVVGDSNNGNSSVACLFTGVQVLDLNTLIPANSGWTLQQAWDINDLNQIVGVGINPQGQSEAFLLTPVPEPAMGLVLSLSLSAITQRRRPKSSSRAC